MPSRRALAPAVLGVCSALVLTAAVVSAADLRGDEQRARAQAQERRDVDAWLTAVRPLADRLYDHIQPLQKALEDTVGPAQLVVDVLEDVSQELVDAGELVAVADELGQTTPPKTVSADRDALVAAVREMAEAATTASTVFDAEQEEALVDALVDSDLALDRATRDYEAAIVRMHGGRPLPPVPDILGESDPARASASRAAYLQAAGAVCAGSLDEVAAAGDGGSDEDERRRAEALVTVLRRDVPLLAAVPAPPRDADLVRDTIATPLQGTLALVEGLDAALAAQDEAAARAAGKLLSQGELAAEKAAAGYREYGSATCSGFLVGFEGAEDDPAQPA